MVTAKTQYNLKNAEEYFEEHLCVGDYYDEGQRVTGQWFGLGAERLGLSNKVGAEAFLHLCENRHPTSGETLTQRLNTTRMDAASDTTANRRIFYDFTFSPPKSVSVAALVGADERILEAHAQAVRSAMNEFEAFATTRVRVGKANSDRTTGNFVAATFTHDTSRALDPHLHMRPSPNRRLTEFEVPDGVLFRVRVVQPPGQEHHKLLGEADGIPFVKVGEASAQRRPLLEPVPDALDQLMWKIDMESDPPKLLVNKDAQPTWKEMARSPYFIALVYPEVMRRLLTTVLIEKEWSEDEDESGWESDWIRFARNLGGLGKVERRRRDAGTQPERNDRRRTAGGSTPIFRCHTMPLVTSALFAERNRRGREGNRADHQPVK